MQMKIKPLMLQRQLEEQKRLQIELEKSSGLSSFHSAYQAKTDRDHDNYAC